VKFADGIVIVAYEPGSAWVQDQDFHDPMEGIAIRRVIS